MPTTQSQSEIAVSLLNEVAEEWKAFWCNHGVVAKSLREMHAAIDDMNADEFAHHVNGARNDVANWIEQVIGDSALALKLRLLSTREATSRMIGRRIDELASHLPIAEIAADEETATVEAVVEEPALAMSAVSVESAVAAADAALVKRAVAPKKAVRRSAPVAKKALATKRVAKKAQSPAAPKKTSLLDRLLKF